MPTTTDAALIKLLTEALLANQEALRDARHLLRTTANQLLGTLESPKGSPLAKVIESLSTAETQTWAALRETNKKRT